MWVLEGPTSSLTQFFGVRSLMSILMHTVLCCHGNHRCQPWGHAVQLTTVRRVCVFVGMFSCVWCVRVCACLLI